MEYLVVGAAALCASALTLFSGFGLGTLLLPVFALFFPPAVAVAATAVVHMANNLLKVAVVGRRAEMGVVFRFGVPAVLAAMLGASALVGLARMEASIPYAVGGRVAEITPLKLVIAALMVVFALFELVPRLRGLRVDRRYLTLGGLMSGFFGGLSGHQGALRATFLTKVGLEPAAFIGTNAVLGALVDATRLATYAAGATSAAGGSLLGEREWPLVAVGVGAALLGVAIGGRFVRKATMGGIQLLTGVLLLVIAGLLGSGII